MTQVFAKVNIYVTSEGGLTWRDSEPNQLLFTEHEEVSISDALNLKRQQGVSFDRLFLIKREEKAKRTKKVEENG